jgi:2-polyprenyl-3-methyl-5-hydroxy-6-metoxy-1,4-benzoquinol methylase
MEILEKNRSAIEKEFEANLPTFGDMIQAWAEGSPTNESWGDKFHIIQDIQALGKAHTVVDIGPGDGTISHALASYYEKFILVDSFKENLAITRKRLISTGLLPENIRCIQGEMIDQNIILKNQLGKIDRILNIHNFYYLVYESNGQEKMIECLKQNISYLKPGGISFSVLKHPSEGDSSRMFAYFHGKEFELDLEKVGLELKKSIQNIKVEYTIKDVEVRCKELRQAVLAALLVLLHYEKIKDFDFSHRMDEIIGYVADRFYQSSTGFFVIPQKQIHLSLIKV